MIVLAVACGYLYLMGALVIWLLVTEHAGPMRRLDWIGLVIWPIAVPLLAIAMFCGIVIEDGT